MRSRRRSRPARSTCARGARATRCTWRSATTAPRARHPRAKASGLSNIRARLRLLYGDAHAFELIALPAGGTEARVRLPLSARRRAHGWPHDPCPCAPRSSTTNRSPARDSVACLPRKPTSRLSPNIGDGPTAVAGLRALARRRAVPRRAHAAGRWLRDARTPAALAAPAGRVRHRVFRACGARLRCARGGLPGEAGRARIGCRVRRTRARCTGACKPRRRRITPIASRCPTASACA